ncbi:MAG: hypothetical protein ACOCTH_01285 [Halodesulfurarchaeum sp.]
MTDDFSGMVEDDLERVSGLVGGGLDTSIPSIIELFFGAATTFVAVTWFVTMFFVPDPIDGQAWFSLGMLGLFLFGVPAAGTYWLRRGGADVIMAVLRAYAR